MLIGRQCGGQLDFPLDPLAVAEYCQADILAGVPSIVVGVFAYAIIVRPMHSYSALSAGVALAIIPTPFLVSVLVESRHLASRY
jgi:phosphate transport system permease protein